MHSPQKMMCELIVFCECPSFGPLPSSVLGDLARIFREAAVGDQIHAVCHRATRNRAIRRSCQHVLHILQGWMLKVHSFPRGFRFSTCGIELDAGKISEKPVARGLTRGHAGESVTRFLARVCAVWFNAVNARVLAICLLRHALAEKAYHPVSQGIKYNKGS